VQLIGKSKENGGMKRLLHNSNNLLQKKCKENIFL